MGINHKFNEIGPINIRAVIQIFVDLDQITTASVI